MDSTVSDQDLQQAYELLHTAMPLSQMQADPALNTVLNMVARNLRRKPTTASPAKQTTPLRMPSTPPQFDAKRAAAHDEDDENE